MTLLYGVSRVKAHRLDYGGAYDTRVPKLWNETIDEHRRAVNEAILDTTAALVAEHGPASVTMSGVAERTGIGRATLYKYFPDIDSILLAWHERQITRHLHQLAEVRAGTSDPGAALEAVLTTYALAQRGHGHGDVAAALHRGEHVARAHQYLRDFVRDLLAAAAGAGDLRTDVDPEELAVYCLHALGAAGALPSEAAVHRLVTVTLSGLRP